MVSTGHEKNFCCLLATNDGKGLPKFQSSQIKIIEPIISLSWACCKMDTLTVEHCASLPAFITYSAGLYL